LLTKEISPISSPSNNSTTVCELLVTIIVGLPFQPFLNVIPEV
jgi:hypothetical protein